MSPKGGDRGTAYAVFGLTAQQPGGVQLSASITNGTMSSEDCIKTSASDLPPHAPSFSAASGQGPGALPPTMHSGSAGSSGGVPPEDWGLTIGSSFPSVEQPKYVIKAEIDDGGMGIVYEAHQGELGVVAIKVIKPRILGQAASERFLNEARAMAKVRAEPGIATIFDCDWYTDSATGTRAPFIVMEYVPGGLPITTYANEHQLGLRARLELFQKVCEAVAAAHRADIIHRDLKPSNVMVDAKGHPKVIDFGLAVVRDPTEHTKRLPSERGGLFGTLEYMSPEQAAKRFDPHVLTAASDVYSLGVILYELLLGQLPYADHPGTAVKKSETGVADYTEATRIIREEPPVSPHRLNRGIHPGVEGILLKALEKEPGKRFGTAGEFSAAIAGHLKWGRKRDVAMAAPVVLLAAWLAGIIAVPVFFFWTPVSTWYLQAAAAVSPPVTEMKHVILLTVDETTDPLKFGDLKAQAGPPFGFGLGERSRPLLGAICEKLSLTACEVVALDMKYEKNPPDETARDDDLLLAGAAALRAKGIGWVMLAPEWQDLVANPPRAVTDSDPLTGSPWLYTERTFWTVEVALERSNAVMASFSLMSAAAYRHENSMFVFRFDNESFGVLVTAVNNVTKKQTQDRTPLIVSRVVPGDAPEASLGHAGSKDAYTGEDRLALLTLPPFPSDEALERARLSANDLMAMSDAEAADRCREKVVVISNRHEDFKEWEWAIAPDGRLLPKSYGHALAIETLLRGHSTIRVVDRYGQEIATLLAATLGAMIAGWWSSSWVRAVAVGVICAVGMAGLSLLVVKLDGFVCNPIVPSVAMWLAIAMGLLIPPGLKLAGRMGFRA